MAWKNKVVWSEGMLLQPQHLQQHDRYWENQLESRVAALRPYGWGFSELKIDEHQLGLGKLALRACSGVLPDGTPFVLPADGELPLPLDVAPEARNVLVMLALPLRRHGVAEVRNGDGAENLARYQSADYEVWDSNGLDNSALLQVGQLRVRLALAPEVANAHAALAVARVVERHADNRLALDPDFSAPCLDVRAAPRLASFADELVGLLHQRGDLLAARLAQPGALGAGEIGDFLLLQLLNRAEPLVSHLAGASGVHPESLFQVLVALAGELATFTDPGKRAAAYPTYRHDQLAETFAPVIADLRRALSTVMDTQAVAIALDERQFGIRVAVVPDRELLRSATFVLAVNAHMPPEALRGAFPAQVKIGSVEKIRDLVNLQLPGIGLRPLPVAPRQLPFFAGYTYFELDGGSEYFKHLHQSAGFAMHVAGDFPGLQMQFWAIRR
jgi:type VI secretion system protein ImpJ